MRKPHLTIVGLLTAVAFLMAAAYGTYAWRSAKEEQLSTLSNVARLAAQSSELFFKHFQLGLQGLGQSILAEKAGPNSRAVHSMLMRFHHNDDRLVVSNLFSPDGRFLASSRVQFGEKLPDVSSNDLLQTGLREALHKSGMQIGQTHFGVMAKEWVIPFRYVTRDAANQPMFIVTSSVPMRKQQDIWRLVSLPEGGAIGLIRDDGIQQGRWPEPTDPTITYTVAAQGLLRDTVRNQQLSNNAVTDGFTGVGKGGTWIAYHRVDGFPLTAYVEIPSSVVWGRWIEHVRFPFLLFALMACCSGWVFVYATRHQQLLDREMRERQRRLELRNEIAALAMQGFGESQLIEASLGAIGKRFTQMWVAYSSLTTDGKMVIRQVSHSSEQALVGCKLDLTECPHCALTLRHGGQAVVQVVAKDPAWDRLLNSGKCRAGTVINLPMVNPSGLFGILSIVSLAPYSWEANDRALLAQGSSYLSLAIHEAQSKQAREQALEQLKQSEERFRHLTELSSDWYWEQDEEMRYTALPGVTERTGHSLSSVIGKARWELPGILLTEKEWDEHRAMLKQRKPFYDFTFERERQDGGPSRVIALSGCPIFDSEGSFKGYRGIGKDITERVAAEKQIKYLAFHDGLTALPNRAMFSQILNLRIGHARRYNNGLAVLFIDLDRFKNINDTLGHDAGDDLLKEIGKRLQECVRQSDAVARLGGDEFVVLLDEIDDAKQVVPVARKILSAISKPFELLGQEFRVTTSIGIALYAQDGEDEQALMKSADIAMYRAKEEGKNNFQFHAERMDTHTFERLALESSLRRALEREEFELHYQPKMNAASGKMNGMEALVRWNHPDLGMVAPSHFIPVAEETGLIVPIGKWVLMTACATNKGWQEEGLPPLCVAVNLSARQFEDENLVNDIASVLQETGLEARWLELELTESMVMRNVDKAVTTLRQLKDMGVRVAIDDFGTGYSSLSNLKRFPIDTIKVDRSFIRDIPADTDDNALTRAIIAMGKSLSLTVVAEGVETKEQVEFLREHACDEFQGFFFSKPVNESQFRDLIYAAIGVSPSPLASKPQQDAANVIRLRKSGE